MKEFEFKIKEYGRDKQIILNSLYNHLLFELKNNKNYNKNDNKNDNSFPKIVFKPGRILLSILKDESLILKNIHKAPLGFFERFSELFSCERNLSLNEDIYKTLFNKGNIDYDDELSNKSIKIKYPEHLYIIATCPENSFNLLSNSVISKFSVIYVGEHEIKEKQRIIWNYLNSNCHIINDEIFNKIFNIISGKIINDKFFNIKKAKILIDIFNEMNKNNLNYEQEENILYFKNIKFKIFFI